MPGAMGRQYLQAGVVEEECQQLDEVVEHIGVLLLHPDDVGWVVRLVLVQFHILVPGEEPILEEVLDHNRHLHRCEKLEEVTPFKNSSKQGTVIQILRGKVSVLVLGMHTACGITNSPSTDTDFRTRPEPHLQGL